MYLSGIIENLGCSFAGLNVVDFKVKGISSDSRKVKDGFVFVAIKGANDNGERFIRQALRNGAGLVISQGKGVKINVSSGRVMIKVNDPRTVLAMLAAEFYAYPSRDIKTVGVTGTNGKTTITYLLESILKKSGFNPAVVGTVNYRFGGRVLDSFNTTPGPVEMQSLMNAMRKRAVDYLAMEVSSHALSQRRVSGIDFHSAIFTNLTLDHLDYHKNMRNYFLAKAELFRTLGMRSFAVFNNDDPYAKELCNLTRARKVTYALNRNADFKAKNIKLSVNGSRFSIDTPGNKINIVSSLIGAHNVYNILASYAWAFTEGLDCNIIKKGIEEFSCVPGRLERVKHKSGPAVFVDYAHTPDALKNVISSLRQIKKGNIIVVFGCGGERDRSKRPKMGRLATELSDYVFITSDNPRSEDPLKIINEIKCGIRKNNYSIFVDRKEAIEKALSMAKRADMILIAGKGHENYQIFKDGKIFFDDKEVAERCLERMNSW